MEQFSLDKWLQDKSRKVVTRDGREVEILKTNRKDGIHPIIFSILDQNGVEQVHFCNKVGICTTLPSPNKFDLFFVDDEELTEFEQELKVVMDKEAQRIIGLKYEAKNILNLARKQIQPEIDSELDEAYNQGRADALKDLPKWKKFDFGNDFNGHLVVIPATKWGVVVYNTDDKLFITREDLEKLPKE